MLVRLIPDQGGDGSVCGIIAMNDTGSNVLTLFDTDMPHLGNLQGYAGRAAIIIDASGTVNLFPMIVVEVDRLD
jgi:hypothetical protein